MKAVRFHGRGGQGVVTAADLLAIAAFHDGKYSAAFPSFGSERRGAPVVAFCRVDSRPIRGRSQIYSPDYIIVQDATLMDVVNIFDGLKDEGKAIINTEKALKPKTKAEVRTINGTKIALEILGVPIVNTLMLGAFAASTGEISLVGLEKAIRGRFPEKLAKKNVAAAEAAYKMAGGKA
ncbi:MAG: pyruvate ferredoxin oxidoreductase subunit gamma [Euryarchaeota archaeon]|nr:pyruvate ferredoxin oxidoreductase subunit gamma [Euryarchaeota archaeon]